MPPLLSEWNRQGAEIAACTSGADAEQGSFPVLGGANGNGKSALLPEVGRGQPKRE